MAREECSFASVHWQLASPVIPTRKIIFAMLASGDARKKSIILLNYPTLLSATYSHRSDHHPTSAGVP